MEQPHLYLRHFQLKEPPFKITPTTDFFYGGGQRGEILHALTYAVRVGEGIVMVTGEVGSGKTMMMRTLMERLGDEVEIVYIANPSLSGREILYNICEELGLEAKENRPDTVRLLQNRLIELHAAGRRVVAFVDEAQAVPDESLEEIRLLSNLETSRDKLLQIFLFGQPELEEKISRQNMRQLRERISVKLNLKPFNRDDVREYIALRLRVAGYNGKPMFSSGACHLIAVVSLGISRRINVLADKSLLAAYERNSLSVSFADARRAVNDVNFGKLRYRSERARRVSKQMTAALAAGACVLLALAITTRSAQEPPAATAPATPVAEVSPAPAPESQEAQEPPAPAAEAAAESAAQPPAESAVEAAADAVANAVASAKSFAVTTASVAPAAAPAEQQQSAPTPAPAPQAAAPTPARQNLINAVAALSRGEGRLNRKALEEEIAASAESHTDDAPQAQGGEAVWQDDVKIYPETTASPQWAWMPASSYLRNRLAATEKLFKTQNRPAFYTARLLTVERRRAVFLEKFIRYFADFYPSRNLMVYPARLQSGDKFVVTYGIYNNRNDAEIFIGNLPYYFTGGRPHAQTLKQSAQEAADQWQAGT